jgi:primosomal protein N'
MITGMVLVIYSTFRSISKNKYKRYQELRAFENLLLIVKREIYGLKIKFGDFRKYKIFKCPSCAQKLRVPRKKGKLTITCKKCGAEFKGKS